MGGGRFRDGFLFFWGKSQGKSKTKQNKNSAINWSSSILSLSPPTLFRCTRKACVSSCDRMYHDPAPELQTETTDPLAAAQIRETPPPHHHAQCPLTSVTLPANYFSLQRVYQCQVTTTNNWSTSRLDMDFFLLSVPAHAADKLPLNTTVSRVHRKLRSRAAFGIWTFGNLIHVSRRRRQAAETETPWRT